MSGLAYATLEQLWTEAGGPSAAAPTAAAIAIAESGGNPSSIQQGQPYATTGWGLWQITPGDSEPQLGTNSQLLDPLTNARAAVAKFNAAGGTFEPWTTYTGGEYRQYLNGTNYSGNGTNTAGGSAAANSAAAANAPSAAAIFQWQTSLLGQSINIDMDGFVGTLCMTAGIVVMAAGLLVVMATGLSGPLSAFAKSYAPIKAISEVQARRNRTARQAATETRLGMNTQIAGQAETRLQQTEDRRAASQAARIERETQAAAQNASRERLLMAERRARVRQQRARARIIEARARQTT